ncbi:MAG: hypothetical protein AAFX06_28985 [Planctomycetota bacterium]
MVNSPNTIKLGDQAFPVVSCFIWGYIGRKDNAWYCRWGFDAEGESQARRCDDEQGSYDYELKPCLSANTVPISVSRWRDLDGVTFQTGEHGEVDFYRGHDAFYTVQTMSPHETCSNNRISISHVRDTKFRLRWSGEAYLHGVEADKFHLDAIAEFSGVTFTSEVESESDVNDDEIGRIFREVFPHDDFVQHPATIRKISEDGLRYMDFTARFTPR